MREFTSFLNGTYIPGPPCISAWDAGFVQGSSVSEQLRTFQGQLFAWERHRARLQRSLEIVGVPLPMSWGELGEIMDALVRQNHALLEPGDDLS
ncbi:MAG TPA: aminotransferase class IV, partial [Pirellulaceae bacterium]